MALSFARSAVVGASLLILAAALAHAATLTYPPVVNPDANGITQVTLIVDAARVTLVDAGSFNTRAYYYNGVAAPLGPTLNLQPGGALNLTLINRLGPNRAGDTAMNTYHRCNTTNIHTHGLHADPSIDSVFRIADPGTSLNYYLPITAEHSPGMHWYHTHAHGSSNLLLMGGLLGAMYVLPTTATQLPTSLRGLTEHVMVIQMFRFTAADTQDCDGRGSTAFDPFKIWSFGELETSHQSVITNQATLLPAITAPLITTVNGMYTPTINMQPGQTVILKMVYAAGAGRIKLQVQGCTMVLLATDGIYLTAPRTVTFVHFIPATRYEVALTCSTTGNFNAQTIINGGGTIFRISVSGTTVTSATIPALLGVPRPYYLTDLATATPTALHTVSFSQAGVAPCTNWMGQGTDCSNTLSQGPILPQCPFSMFQGERGTDASKYEFKARVGDIAEWKIYGVGNEPHPMHIHVNHFQLMSYTPIAGTGANIDEYSVQLGDWRDTFPAIQGTAVIRFNVATFAGEVIYHCHVLSHEDRGLMSSYLIQPALTTPAPPGSTPAPPTTPSPLAPTPVTPGTPGTPFTPVPGIPGTPFTPTPFVLGTPIPRSAAAVTQATFSVLLIGFLALVMGF